VDAKKRTRLPAGNGNGRRGLLGAVAGKLRQYPVGREIGSEGRVAQRRGEGAQARYRPGASG